jgi:hypothetical protein
MLKNELNNEIDKIIMSLNNWILFVNVLSDIFVNNKAIDDF